MSNELAYQYVAVRSYVFGKVSDWAQVFAYDAQTRFCTRFAITCRIHDFYSEVCITYSDKEQE